MSTPVADAPRFYAQVRCAMAPCVAPMIRRAAKQAGYDHGTEWLRDRVARMLAHELGEDYEKIMAGMPPNWRTNPGAAILESQADKASVQEGQVG